LSDWDIKYIDFFFAHEVYEEINRPIVYTNIDLHRKTPCDTGSSKSEDLALRHMPLRKLGR
jgi:hypothetical protein